MSVSPQERLQVFGEDLMEHGVLGVSRAIHGLGTRHPSGYRAPSGAPMPRERYARSRAPGATGLPTGGTRSTRPHPSVPGDRVAANRRSG